MIIGIVNRHPENLIVETSSIILVLHHLGFVINWEDLVPVPQQQLEYLGFNSNLVAIALPKDKIQNTKELA